MAVLLRMVVDSSGNLPELVSEQDVADANLKSMFSQLSHVPLFGGINMQGARVID